MTYLLRFTILMLKKLVRIIKIFQLTELEDIFFIKYNCLKGIKIPIYGDGKNVRDWLHVSDHVRALKLVMKKGKSSNRYNIGGGKEITNNKLVRSICKKINELNLPAISWDCLNLISYVKDRPGYDFRYTIDYGLIKKELGYIPMAYMQEKLNEVILFYIQEYEYNAY